MAKFPFPFGGMVDPVIVGDGLTALGLEPGADLVDAVLAHYVEVLQDEVERAEVYRVHDGVHAVLQTVSCVPGVAVGLGTGNIEAGARVKLERVGLNPYFSFGGYGSDAASRPALIGRGAARGAKMLGVPLEDCRLVIIGDTPKDVEAAHHNGGECVAVSTGGSSSKELTAAGPEFLFETLEHARALDAILEGK
jgi:phosphoglycolate phosphatase-like HAD superfamily hydrolase